MRINSVGYSHLAQRTKKKSNGADFSSSIDSADDENGPSPLAAVNALSLDGFLALQTTDSSDDQALQQGHNMLDMLEGLRLSILSGSLTLAQLKRLEQTVKTTTFPTAPHLQEALKDIRLRVRVELAKYNRAHNLSSS